MAHSIQHMQSRRAEQWLTPSSTCKAGEQSNGSLHPAHAKPESRAMVRSIQHMQSRRAEQWFTPSSTCKAGEQSNGSLHLAYVMAHSIQHMQSRRAEQWLTPSSTCKAGGLTPSSTCKAGEQSNGSLHPAHAKPESRAMARSIQHNHSKLLIIFTLLLTFAAPLHAFVYTCTCTVCVKKNFPYRWNIYTHFLFDYRHNSIVVVPTTGMV